MPSLSSLLKVHLKDVGLFFQHGLTVLHWLVDYIPAIHSHLSRPGLSGTPDAPASVYRALGSQTSITSRYFFGVLVFGFVLFFFIESKLEREQARCNPLGTQSEPFWLYY